MTRATCTTLPHDLLAYWLGELDAAQEQRLDEHLFACAACSARLQAIVDLGAAIRRETLRGDFGFVAPEAFIRRMKATGLRVREYTLEPGDSVNCTITRDDDLLASYLRAPLGGVRRLDLLIDDEATGQWRLTDVAFDPAAGGLTMVPSVSFVRAMGHARQRVQLIAVDGASERVIADYTFNHSPS